MITVKIKRKKIIVTGDNPELLSKLGEKIKEVITESDDVQEYLVTYDSKVLRGRPSPSCFESDDEEAAFKEMLNIIKGSISDCCYSVNTVCAYLSIKTIGRYKNQKYFCKILNEAGININYSVYMRELEKLHRKGSKMMNKLERYFNQQKQFSDIDYLS